MIATEENNSDQNLLHLATRKLGATQPYRLSLPEADLLSIPDEEDEVDIDETTEDENTETESSIQPLPILTADTVVPTRPLSDFSHATESIRTTTKSSSRSYRFIQLEKALLSAKLLESNDDQLKFKSDYRESIRENKFDEFLKTYYKRLQDHRDKIQRENYRKKIRTFTFVDLEQKFLASDPTHDIKIVFINDPMSESIRKMTDIQQTKSINQNLSLLAQAEMAATNEFYENRIGRLLRNPSRAREEITMFARRAGQRLHEQLPRISRVPHRVDIVDQRGSQGNLDDRTLKQMKHRHNMSLIAQRRQSTKKMMTQAIKNQIKMEKLNLPAPIKIHRSCCCRDLFEEAAETEAKSQESELEQSHAVSFIASQQSNKIADSSYLWNANVSESKASWFSTSTASFQNTFNTNPIKRSSSTRVLPAKRPLTAPVKKIVRFA